MKASYLKKFASAVLTRFTKEKPCVHYDKIGPPDKLSNLRPIQFAVQEKETPLEFELRLLRNETQKWHQDFWVKHNNNFNGSRQKFVSENSKDGQSGLSSDEMAVFYKKFLDENYQLFKEYNSQWYKKNARILWLTVRTSRSRSKSK